MPRLTSSHFAAGKSKTHRCNFGKLRSENPSQLARGWAKRPGAVPSHMRQGTSPTPSRLSSKVAFESCIQAQNCASIPAVSTISESDASQVAARLRGYMYEMYGGLVRMTSNRFLWRSLDDALHERSHDTPSTWLNHYRDIYVEAQVIGLRRFVQGDNQEGHLTLSRVLGTLFAQPEVINVRHLDSLADVCSGPARVQMELDWLTDKGILNRSIPARDLQLLTKSESATRVLRWANRQVAHTYPIEAIQTTPPPIFADIHSVLDTAREIYSRYHHLLAGTFIAEEVSVYPTNWTNSFDRPIFDRV
jgi:hypothetical protein